MKLVWKKKKLNAKVDDHGGKKRPRTDPNLPFDFTEVDEAGVEKNCNKLPQMEPESESHDPRRLAELFLAEGNRLAENGKFHDALGKWEAALTLAPNMAILHEQKAQLLLEIGDAWGAVKAATRATELEPLWAEAWITLGRAQLNFGEPDLSIKSFDKSLDIKPGNAEALSDRVTALQLVRKRKQLRVSGSSLADNRFTVGDKFGLIGEMSSQKDKNEP